MSSYMKYFEKAVNKNTSETAFGSEDDDLNFELNANTFFDILKWDHFSFYLKCMAEKK